MPSVLSRVRSASCAVTRVNDLRMCNLNNNLLSFKIYSILLTIKFNKISRNHLFHIRNVRLLRQSSVDYH